jgi:hypothetical protein
MKTLKKVKNLTMQRNKLTEDIKGEVDIIDTTNFQSTPLGFYVCNDCGELVSSEFPHLCLKNPMEYLNV